MFEILEVSFPKVKDYVGYCDKYPKLVTDFGDLKDVQRPWAVAEIYRRMPRGAKVLDLGGAVCEVASHLMDDFETTVVDPYDGSGGGPKWAAPYREKYPKLNILQAFLTEETPVPNQDAVLSTSVVEHIPVEKHQETVLGIAKSLKPGGLSVHAIDVTCRGVNGFLEMTQGVAQNWVRAHGIADFDIEPVVNEMLDTVDTYMLPATAYQKWRGARTYDEYPWRKVSSLQVVLKRL